MVRNPNITHTYKPIPSTRVNTDQANGVGRAWCHPDKIPWSRNTWSDPRSAVTVLGISASSP